MTMEYRQAFQCMETTVTKCDGKYQVALPWRHYPTYLPNDTIVAEKRLQYLKRKLQSDSKLHQAYLKTVNDYIDKGYAEEIDEKNMSASSVWYLPHHPVKNPNKPGKVGMVFDCAAKYQCTSLNKQLLQGPDFMNSLIGVIIRFRQEAIAWWRMSRRCFYQVKVPC